MRIAFVTFGCRLNRAESLDLESVLSASGHEIIHLHARSDPTSQASDPICRPDLIVVRGCSVTAKAQRDCEKAIEHLRHRFPCAHIAITGCLPDAKPLPPQILKGSDHAIPWGQTNIPTSTSRAYLKVQDGCNGKCSFCIVPHFRGPPVSIPLADVIARAKAFISAGYHEIVMTGCNLSLYKSDENDLPKLLDALASLFPQGSDPTSISKYRVRLGSLEPGMLSPQILDILEKHQNICRFLHLSIQSGSDRILSAMNRPYHIGTVADFVRSVHERFDSRIMVGADIITGFPGETEEDFNATRDFLADNNFTHVHAFPFSERPGTPAATMARSVPIDIRRERARIIIKDAALRRYRFAESFIGQEVEVCVENGCDHGWTDEYLQVKLSSHRPRRTLVRATIVAAKDDILLEMPEGAIPRVAQKAE